MAGSCSSGGESEGYFLLSSTSPSSQSIRTAGPTRNPTANQVDAAAYGHEAGHFQRAGGPAVICGPGSIEQAHKADEFVALPELTACEGFLRKVIARAAA